MLCCRSSIIICSGQLLLTEHFHQIGKRFRLTHPEEHRNIHTITTMDKGKDAQVKATYDVNKDYYAILGLPKGISDGLRVAYHRLAKELHPDKNNGDDLKAERFKEVQEAYSVLANPEQKERYDRDRMLTGKVKAPPPQPTAHPEAKSPPKPQTSKSTTQAKTTKDVQETTTRIRKPQPNVTTKPTRATASNSSTRSAPGNSTQQTTALSSPKTDHFKKRAHCETDSENESARYRHIPQSRLPREYRNRESATYTITMTSAQRAARKASSKSTTSSFRGQRTNINTGASKRRCTEASRSG